MFFGEFEYRIDEKGRVPIPPKFRGVLKAGIVLMPGAEGCITAYPLNEWQKLADSLTAGSLPPSKLRTLNRAVFAMAYNLKMDAQGRIALPASLKVHAEIVSEVVIIGANTYLEFWNKVRWGEEKAIDQERFWQLLEGVEKRP